MCSVGCISYNRGAKPGTLLRVLCSWWQNLPRADSGTWRAFKDEDVLHKLGWNWRIKTYIAFWFRLGDLPISGDIGMKICWPYGLVRNVFEPRVFVQWRANCSISSPLLSYHLDCCESILDPADVVEDEYELFGISPFSCWFWSLFRIRTQSWWLWIKREMFLPDIG